MSDAPTIAELRKVLLANEIARAQWLQREMEKALVPK